MNKPNSRAIAVLALGALCAFSANADAADITVSPGQSIVSAVNSANPGDRVLLRTGTYPGGGWIERNGTASAPITILAMDGPRTAKITGGGESLRAGNSSYLVFDGLEVSGSGDNTVHIDRSHHITLRNMFAHDAGFQGDVLKVNQSHHMIIERSEFARPGRRDVPENPYQECLDFVDVDDSVIRDNWIHDGGSMLMFVKGGSRNTVIERNLMSQQRAGASDPTVGLGGPTDLALLQGEQYEIINVIFRNNIVMNGTTGAVAIYDANGAYVANNLFINNDRVLIEFRAGNGPARLSTAIRVVNNIMMDTRGTMPTPYRLSSHGLSDFTTSNNLYWNAGGAIPSSYNTISPTGQPGHVVADPLIALPSASGTRSSVITTATPRTGSPAAGSGINASAAPYGVVDDINGALRGSQYDRGTHRLSGGTTTTTPTTTTPPATTTSGAVTSVAYTASPTTGVAGQVTTLRATSVGSTSPLYRFWIVTPAGSWTQPCGGYSASATCAFTPGYSGAWKIAVSARDVNSSATFDATTNEQPYSVAATAPTTTTTPPTTTTGTKVTSVSFAVSPTTGVVGAVSTLTATSTGSASPRYRFWAVTPTGQWTQPCGDYGTSNTCAWRPDREGTWQLSVSARDAASTAQYDATAVARAYSVAATAPTAPTTTTGTRVTSVSLASVTPATGVVGAPTTLTATSTGSASPQYRFWAVTPAGQWTQPCGDYSSSSSCSWRPDREGTWKLTVSARDASSTEQYQATTVERSYSVSATVSTTTPTTTTPTTGTTTTTVASPGVAVPALSTATTANVQAILTRGAATGQRKTVFAKIGDSITESQSFLGDIGHGWYDLGSYTALATAIQSFSSTTFSDGANSFWRQSTSATAGWTTTSVLAGPLVNELSAIRPAYAIIMLGTNDLDRMSVDAYRTNMQSIITQCVQRNVVPILSTIPDRRDSSTKGALALSFNDAIRSLAAANNIPLLDYWAGLQPLPNHGVSSDGVHPNTWIGPDGSPSAGYFSATALQYGYNLRNLTAVQMLDMLRRTFP